MSHLAQMNNYKYTMINVSITLNFLIKYFSTSIIVTIKCLKAFLSIYFLNYKK